MSTVSPKFDIERSDEGVGITIYIPGSRQENVELSVEDGVLELHATVEQPDRTDLTPCVQEFSLRDYHQKFRLAEFFDVEDISADYSAGVLNIYIPQHEKHKPKKIDVQERIH